MKEKVLDDSVLVEKNKISKKISEVKEKRKISLRKFEKESDVYMWQLAKILNDPNFNYSIETLIKTLNYFNLELTIKRKYKKSEL